MDVLYLFKHSDHNDEELRYSLRSLHQYAPFVETVWVFGDKPEFLNEAHLRVRHVPHEYTARATGVKTPIVNTFLMLYHASLIPELSHEFLWFCDDYIVLDRLAEEVARRDRYLQKLEELPRRGRGLWKDALWRTHDLLLRLGYTAYNFESHSPTFLTKRRIFEAYCEFKDFTTEDRWQGMLASTAILNHAHRAEDSALTDLREEGLHIGFHLTQPPYDVICEHCAGKIFLNFDDKAFGPGMRQFLHERFPEPCPFETAGSRGKSFEPPANMTEADLQEPLTGGVFWSSSPGDS